jgi:hypothetical protein
MGSVDNSSPSEIFSEVDGTKVVFTPFKSSNARLVYGNTFPLALNIARADGSHITLDEGAKALRDLSERGITTDLTNKHGAIIFRGVKDSSPRAFSTLIHAAEEGRDRHPFDQVGLAGSRTYLDKDVFSASEAPPHVHIGEHKRISNDGIQH